ncbi:MAG TPA: hypothetical protein PLL30_08115 [Candidatus Krumholzibacteria bacterium]|nr:hypothetical protein [Candidatus Krumholzibacteria bacterium]HPD71721.1 hypothetical protein [Candidatus Krumholzibacteria bacterium]HRY41346.1 hypothetical protein [Candidatus Krumholzibacteria bacterium]
MKRLVPRVITSFVGILLILTAFGARPGPDGGGVWPVRAFDYVDRNFSVWFNILAVFAFILGGASLLKSHVAKVAHRRPDWPYSAVTLVSFVGVLAIGMLKLGGPPGLQGEVTDPGAWFQIVFDAIYDPLLATLYALLAFFITSAAYRAFRLRSPQAAILLASAFIVLLGRTPLGTWLSDPVPPSLGFLRLDALSVWIMSVPNLAGQRAVLIGIAVGVTALTLRILAGRGEVDGGGA